MELEFDKEMDAILRRSGPAALRGVLVGDKPPVKHLDADAIAAFVENAVPTPTRRLYMGHFADCDRCRKLLSTSILMNESAAKAAAPAAVVVAAGESISWYQRIFRTPNMALAMGALVLTFSGILGYLTLQNREGASVTVSQVSTDEIPKGGPSVSTESTAANSNAAAANAVANTVASAANTGIEVGDVPATSTKIVSGPSPEAGKDAGIVVGRTEADKEIPEAASAGEPKPVVAPPPPSDDRFKGGATGSVADGVIREKKDEDLALAKRKVAEESRDNRRDLPTSPAKAGPTRSVGPVQSQSNQIQNQVFDMPVTRVVGGKTFDNRSGAWYDRAYKNQQTNNYRRGTNEYNKLDSGLRAIADNLGGTVVMMWKDKAYRIN